MSGDRVWPARLLVAWLTMVSLWAMFLPTASAVPVASSIGLLLTTASPLAWFALAARKQAAHRPHPLGFSVAAGLGLAICMTVSWQHGTVAGNVHVLAGVSLIAWVAYQRWTGASGARPAPGV